jgi:hypothetical protein
MMRACGELLNPMQLQMAEGEIIAYDFQLNRLKDAINAEQNNLEAEPCNQFFLDRLSRLQYLYDRTNKLRTGVNDRIESHNRVIRGCIIDIENDTPKKNSDDGKEGKDGKDAKNGKNGKIASAIGGRRSAKCK